MIFNSSIFFSATTGNGLSEGSSSWTQDSKMTAPKIILDFALSLDATKTTTGQATDLSWQSGCQLQPAPSSARIYYHTLLHNSEMF